MKKRVTGIILAGIMVFLTGCSIIPQYYSKDQVVEFAEAVFGEDITFLSGEKDRKNKQVVYTFADSEQREFTVTTYAKHNSFDGLTLPAYHTWIRESYEKSIYVLYQEEIQEIIEDSGFQIRMITPVDWCDPGHSELNDRPVEIVLTSFHEGEEVYEDLRQLAQIGVEIDRMLHYEYDWQYDGAPKDLYYTNNLDSSLCGMGIVFCNKADDSIACQIYFNFSTNENERWDEDALYEYLKQQVEDRRYETKEKY